MVAVFLAVWITLGGTRDPIPEQGTGDPVPEVEEIARAWAKDGINGEVGDQMVDFIVSKSFTEEPDLLGEYLKEGLEAATIWSYGPIKEVDGGVYEVSAEASTNVHFIMPLQSLNDRWGTRVPLDPEDFKRIATMPYHLRVEMDSKSVTYWHAHPEEGIYTTIVNPDKMPNGETVEEAFGSEAAECIAVAMGKDLPPADVVTLLQPPGMRKEPDLTRLNATLSAMGLDTLCEEWVGNVP